MTDTQFRDTRDAALALSKSLNILGMKYPHNSEYHAEIVKDALIYLLTQDAEQ